MCHHHTNNARKRPRSSSSSLGGRTRQEQTDNKENNGSNKYETRADPITNQSGVKLAAFKRQRSRASPTAVDDQADAPAVDSDTEDSDTDDEEEEDDDDEERATLEHRDEIVAALLTITSALGLSKETLHVCVDVLDRYLQRCGVEISRLEALSIAYVTWLSVAKRAIECLNAPLAMLCRCLWIAAKFVETPITIAYKNIKQTLQRRRLSGNVRTPRSQTMS